MEPYYYTATQCVESAQIGWKLWRRLVDLRLVEPVAYYGPKKSALYDQQTFSRLGTIISQLQKL
jgi:hypothetical protein